MHLYNLDNKITDKSYEILNSHIEEQKQLDNERVSEIRTKCRDILSKNGIFEDRKNGIIYQSMEKELNNLEHNIDYFNEYHFEEITKSKIDTSIENISIKLDSLEQRNDFIAEEDGYIYNKVASENNIRNLLFTYFENYKANTIELLIRAGYSQNTIDNVEEDILEFVTSKSSDVLTEKFSQDRLKSVESLNSSLKQLSNQIIAEAEARYNCELTGQTYDELKDKRESVRSKAIKLEEIRAQIMSLDLKANELSRNGIQFKSERTILQ